MLGNVAGKTAKPVSRTCARTAAAKSKITPPTFAAKRRLRTNPPLRTSPPGKPLLANAPSRVRESAKPDQSGEAARGIPPPVPRRGLPRREISRRHSMPPCPTRWAREGAGRLPDFTPRFEAAGGALAGERRAASQVGSLLLQIRDRGNWTAKTLVEILAAVFAQDQVQPGRRAGERWNRSRLPFAVSGDR